MMSRDLFTDGPMQSDYIMNQFNEQEQTRESGLLPTSVEQSATTPPRRPSAIPSQYVDMDLRSFIAVNQNRNYQEFPSTVHRTPLVGHPISANELRRRVETLDNALYSPVIVDGRLFFVCLDGDTGTARPTQIDSHIRHEIF